MSLVFLFLLVTWNHKTFSLIRSSETDKKVFHYIRNLSQSSVNAYFSGKELFPIQFMVGGLKSCPFLWCLSFWIDLLRLDTETLTIKTDSQDSGIVLSLLVESPRILDDAQPIFEIPSAIIALSSFFASSFAMSDKWLWRPLKETDSTPALWRVTTAFPRHFRIFLFELTQ